jgi:hypothetical protein
MSPYSPPPPRPSPLDSPSIEVGSVGRAVLDVRDAWQQLLLSTSEAPPFSWIFNWLDHHADSECYSWGLLVVFWESSR